MRGRTPGCIRRGFLAVAVALMAAATVLPPGAAAQTPGQSWSAYVGVRLANEVDIIDTGGDSLQGEVQVGRAPWGVALLPDGSRAYVANQGTDDVSVIDTATATVVATVPVGEVPVGVAISPDGSRAYVACVFDDRVTVIDTATNAVIALIPVTPDSEPNSVAVSPDGSRLYLTQAETDTVSVIDTATATVVATVPVGDFPIGIAVTPDGGRVYVANEGSGEVSVIDTATHTVVATVPVDEVPISVAITPDGSRAYVTSQGVEPGAAAVEDRRWPAVPAGAEDESVEDGSPEDGSPDGGIPQDGSPDGAILQDGGGSVSVIDTASNSVVDTILAGVAPTGVAITPDGSRAYVANVASADVSVVDTASNEVTATIPDDDPDDGPWMVAITPDQAPVAALSAGPAAPGATTTLDASASTVAYGTIATYEWDFGDGTTATTDTATTTHVYRRPGRYTVTVTETSSGGTSLDDVFTGQTLSRNGDPHAIATATVDVPLPLTGPGRHTGWLVSAGVVLLGLGATLTAVARRHAAADG